MSDQNAIFEEQLQAWFHTLSPRERSIASTVRDGAFISTWNHFATLSTSSHDDGKAEIDGRAEVHEVNPVSTCDWSKEFLLSDIESIYSNYCERFGMSMESTSAVNLAMRQPSTLSSELLEKTVVIVDSKSAHHNSGDTGQSVKQLSKASQIVAGDNDADRILGSQIGSDATIIQGNQEIESTTGMNDAEALVENDSKADHKATSPEAILSEIQLIFPSVLQAAKEHGLQDLIDFSQVDDTSSTILRLPPSALKSFCAADLHLQCDPGCEGATWITKLREHVQNITPPNNDFSASLSLMMLSRVHVSTTEAFRASKFDEVDKLKALNLIATAEDAVNGEDEQSSFEQYITSPEKGSDDNEGEEIEVVAVTLPATLPSSSFPRNPRKQPFVESAVKPEASPALGLCAVVKQFAIDSDYEEFTSPSFRETALPFISLETVLGYSEAETHELDEVLKQFLSSVLPRAVEAGVLQAPLMKLTDLQANSAIIEVGHQTADASALTLHQSYQSFPYGKKKKKKKKRKRKNSNADLSAGKEVASPEISKALAAAAIALPETPSLSPRIIKQVLVDAQIAELPLLSATNSFDSNCTGQSSNDSGSAVDTGVTVPLISNGDKSRILISRLEGAELTCVVKSGRSSLPKKLDREEQTAAPGASKKADDGDEWEKVASKGRSKNRSKPPDSRRESGYSSQYHQSYSHGSRKVKLGRTAASRRRTANRRMVRDILTSVFDSVEIEVRRKRRAADAKSFEDRRRRSVQPRFITGGAGMSQRSASSTPVSLRDVVMGKQGGVPKKAREAQPPSRSKAQNPVLYAGIVRTGLNEVNKKDKTRGVHSKGTQTIRADQSTAQTIPETLSGTSANTQSSHATEEVDNVDKVGRRESGVAVLIGDASLLAGGGDEEEPNHIQVAVNTENDSSPVPPLPTLLGPGNTNSATSSVASSLEAPHASNHRHHHHSSSCNENDVGYHLLDVCDRLSRDTDVFMTRRSLALTTRRRERGALLAALQDTVSNIWAGYGQVEMYGSCATQLDLPSSDLDAVILGLDAFPIDTSSTISNSASKKHLHRESFGSFDPIPSSPNTPSTPFNQQPNIVLSPFGRTPSNGERVMLLAAELERQPWAVQVKAIPTASVPVVKILADPSKLPGAVSSTGSDGDWMLHQHHMAAQAAAAAAGIRPPPFPFGQTSIFPAPPLTQGEAAYPPHTLPPWRGADVMNGLFSLDITFEGPEHGGLGSTAYSMDIVQEACRETGQPPDGTPLVQVLMVLKELLAQRRLNEPFSGGLSSYALLLLVNAVVKERAIIREEMQRIERHSDLVAAENTTEGSQNLKSKGKPGVKIFSNQKATKLESSRRADKAGEAATKFKKPLSDTQPVPKQQSNSKAPVRISSWASIAKKSEGSNAPKIVPTPQSTSTKSAKAQQKSQPPKVTSFAEAVSRKQQLPPKQDVRKQRGYTLRKDLDLKQSKRLDSNKLEKKSEAKSSSGTAQTPTKARTKERQSPVSLSALHLAQLKSNATPKVPISFKQVTKQGTVQHNKPNSFVQVDSSLSGASSLFPQGSNDVLEVLCSGETTAGKLLMHFLLYYGEHFDSQINAIDVVGSCNPDRPIGVNPSTFHPSPYIPRRSGGAIDPITGMLTVDPIVVYDPWEGGIGLNVARSCYAWSSIRWHFAQCYMTLSSAVERSGTPTTPALASEIAAPCKEGGETSATTGGRINQDTPNSEGNKKNATIISKSSNRGQPQHVDMVSPLLELLLSF